MTLDEAMAPDRLRGLRTTTQADVDRAAALHDVDDLRPCERAAFESQATPIVVIS